MMTISNFNTHSHSTGPPNVPFTKKPYKDLDLEAEEPARTPSARKKTDKKKEKEQRTDGTQKPPQPTFYPTLPSNTEPTPPPIGAHHYQPPPPQPVQGQQAYGGYGAPTYPKQQVYQQQGVPYGGSGQAMADERTRLINQ